MAGNHNAQLRRGDDKRNLLRELLRAQGEEPQYFPVSLPQRRLWFVDQLTPGTAAYNIGVGLRLTGKLDRGALERSIQCIVGRHESLRTGFRIRGGEPMQVVWPSRSIILDVHDLSDSPDEEVERALYSCALREVQKPFNLDDPPLLRFALLRARPAHHVLICVMHHIVSDGWSMRLLVDELTETYDALSKDFRPPLRPLELQYADYAVWQREWLQDAELDRQLAYWESKLANSPTLLALPTDRARTAEQSLDGGSQTIRLPEDLVERLVRLAHRHDATFFMLMLAAFNVLLRRYTGQKDILLGVPMAGRNRLETEKLIGFFVNTIVVRTEMAGDPRFSGVLRQVRETLLEALANQDVPFERVVEVLHPTRSLGHSPLFQVMFATFKAAVQTRQFGQAMAAPYIVDSSTSRFDLSVNLIEGPADAWWVQIEYNTSLFDHARIIRMLDDYTRLLASVIADCRKRLSELWLPADAGLDLAGPGSQQGMLDRAASHRQPDARQYVPARDQLERVLVELWEDILTVSPVGVTDSFFDIGGHSLLAISLLSEVRRVFGKAPPLSTLFYEPTIAYLAKRLRAESESISSLIPLCTTGSKPLFFAGGRNPLYKEVSRALGSDQPFYTMDAYALQEHRMLSEQPLYSTVEEMAAHFARDIISLQPYGPYFLGGLCEGGIVALEVARQLQDQGREVGLFVAFDTPLSGYFRKRWLQNGFYKLWLGLIQLSQGTLASRIRVNVQRARARARARLRKSRQARLNSEEEKYYYIWAVIWNAVFAYKHHRAFQGRIAFIRADEQAWHQQDTIAGWDSIGAKSLQVYGVPGNHWTLTTTYVSYFADTLRTALEQAQHPSRAPAFTVSDTRLSK